MQRFAAAIPSVLGRNASKSNFLKTEKSVRTMQIGRTLSDKVAKHSTTPFPEFDTFTSHDELYKFSLDSPDFFWGTLARSRINWYRDFGSVKDCDLTRGHVRWFLDGQLNVSGNYHSVFY